MVQHFLVPILNIVNLIRQYYFVFFFLIWNIRNFEYLISCANVFNWVREKRIAYAVHKGSNVFGTLAR